MSQSRNKLNSNTNKLKQTKTKNKANLIVKMFTACGDAIHESFHH